MGNRFTDLVVGASIRHALTALSGYLVAQHLLAPEHSASFVNELTTYALDALPGAIAMAWSFIQKRQHAQ